MRLHRSPWAAVATITTLALPGIASAQAPELTSPPWQRARAVWFSQATNPVAAELCIGAAIAPCEATAEQRITACKPGERVALGADWATLDTFTELTFGDVKVPKGCYYLALERDTKGWSLAIFDPSKLQKVQAQAPGGAKDKAIARAPLELVAAKGSDLECNVNPDPAGGDALLQFTWGKRGWSTKVAVQGSKGASPIAQREVRGCSRIAFAAPKAGHQPTALLDHGEPAWNSERDGAAAALKKGDRWRLGENWWTTLDTNAPLVVGGRKIAAGRWHLSLAKTADGWDLALTPATDDVTDGLDAFGVGYAKVAVQVPLSSGKASAPADKLQIRFVADGNATKLAITFGERELTTTIASS